MDIHTKELEYLLNNFWCIKEQNPSLYFDIKNNLDYYKNFIQTKLGSRLLITDRFIKLEKIPSVPKSYMGINCFTDPLEYVILFIILLFLEDKPKLEQFILSSLIDYVKNIAATLELDNQPDWNLFHHRKCLVNVINYLKDLGIIKVVEEHLSFTENANAEALYESTGLSNYYVREFKGNVLEYTTLNDFINDEFSNQNENIGDVRRYKIYRHLLYSLVTYSEDLNEYELDYLRKFRGPISNELSKYTEGELELTKSMALLMYPVDSKEKYDFPNNKAISDIVLMVSSKILDYINTGKMILNSNETFSITKEELLQLINDVRNDNLEYFSKNYKEMSKENFFTEIVNYMKEYDFIKTDDIGYKIYPMVSKFVGYIPKDDKEQLDLFGGSYE